MYIYMYIYIYTHIYIWLIDSEKDAQTNEGGKNKSISKYCAVRPGYLYAQDLSWTSTSDHTQNIKLQLITELTVIVTALLKKII